jgi:predicted ArsR family transcriptional regulator
MRDVGLLQLEVEGKGSVGRPQHRYTLASGAPALGLEPPAYPVLSKMLVQLAAITAALPDESAAAGAPEGRAMAARHAPARAAESGKPARGPHAERVCAKALAAALDELGFDPAMGDDGDAITIAFSHCPFRELAEVFPEVVCNLHRGMIEGFVEQMGGASVEKFSTLADRDPCRVELSVAVSS